MDYLSITEFLAHRKDRLWPGPVALIFVEDHVEIESTIAHHRRLGFSHQLVFLPPSVDPPEHAADISRIGLDTHAPDSVPNAVTRIASALGSIWFYWGYNAEYLYYPFCESRTIGEMLTFHGEERRRSMFATVFDLYAPDLQRHANAACIGEAMVDSSGYYARQRFRDGIAMDRQVDVFGGLRRRFEEHVPWSRRRIDRVPLFQSSPGLKLRSDYTFTDEEMNTFACAWHHNLTAAVVSFRVAKALRSNPGSRSSIETFQWARSVRFEGSSRQLLDLGFMEPGQWF